MAIKTRSITLMSILGILLVAGVVFILVSFASSKNTSSSSTSNKSTNTTASTKPAPTADNNQSQSSKTSPTGPSSLGTNSTPSNPKNPSSGNPTFNVQIVSANLTNNNSNLHVGTMVSGITSGSCELTATQNNGSAISLATSNVKEDVNSYDCGVYNVPVSKFPSSGSWNLILTVTNNGSAATANQNINIP